MVLHGTPTSIPVRNIGNRPIRLIDPGLAGREVILQPGEETQIPPDVFIRQMRRDLRRVRPETGCHHDDPKRNLLPVPSEYEQEPEVEVMERTFPTEGPWTKEELAELNMRQLRELAKEAGITVPFGCSKVELIKLLCTGTITSPFEEVVVSEET
jgi:hypothetical protein